jgi:glycosyltransferase involved in cell wall biosynthesis
MQVRSGSGRIVTARTVSRRGSGPARPPAADVDCPTLARVAYLTPFNVRDPLVHDRRERYPETLAKAVAGTGEHEVEIVTSSHVDAVAVSSLSDRVTLRVVPTANGRAGLDRLSWDLLTPLEAADLVHIHEIFTRGSEVGVLVARLLGKPICVTDHAGGNSGLGRSLGMLDLTDHVICYSEFGRSLITTRTPVTVAPGGVDDEFFVPPSSPEVRDHLLYVGRLIPSKGVDRLVAALPDDVPLTICGRSDETRYLDELRRLARGRRVEFVTASSEADLRALYQRAFAVALPARYGGIDSAPELAGFALLEGMACGAPAIGSRVGGVPEFVDHGETGFVFGELGQLTEQIERLASDREAVNDMGSRARARVVRDFGLSGTGAIVGDVYAAMTRGGCVE